MSLVRRLFLPVLAVVSALGLTLVALPPAANAAVPLQYSASAGGTLVRVLGGAVSSDLTSAAAISGSTYPAENRNTLADANVLNGLATVGVMDSAVSATDPGGVGTITGAVRTAGANLLGGAISVDAIDTAIVAHHDGGNDMGGEVNSRFVGLTIAGNPIPVNVPRGFGITIPGVASVVLNTSKTVVSGGEVTVSGAAIEITLLGAYGESPIGTTIQVNPVNASFAPLIPNDATPVSGFAYGTFVFANVPPLVNAISGTTAAQGMPSRGTAGYPLTNSTAAVDLGAVAKAGAVESTCQATSVPITLDATCSHEIARVNLLGGLVKADALTAVAHLTKDAGGVITTDPSSVIADLRVLGLPVKLKAGATSTITVPNLLTITVNAQEVTANSVTVTALRVVLGAPLLGLPAGAVIEVAKANVATP